MEQLRQVWFYCKRYYLRFLLCVMSIAIATCSMGVLSYLCHIVKKTLVEEMVQMGTDVLLVYVYDTDGLGKDWMASMTDVKCYSHVANDVYMDLEESYDLKFVDADYFSMHHLKAGYGRLFSKWDEWCFNRVAVVGYGLQDTFAIGDFIVYEKQSYQVIGILDRCSESFYGDDNQQIFIPYAFYEGESVQFVVESMSEWHTKRYIKEYASMYGDRVDVFSQSQVKESMLMLLGLLEKVFYLIAGISFLVSMMGISNVMLICVEQRKQEIGIRKALGANAKHIFMEFLLEVVILVCIGFFIGVVLGVIVVLGIAMMLDVTVYVDFGFYGSLFVFCFLISGIVGIFPALLASQKEIVDVLRQ